MIKNPCNFRGISVKMARAMDRCVPLIIMIGVILMNSIDGNSIQCKLCTGRLGVYYCTSVSTECVRIFGTPTIREIKVFSCGVKIMRAGEWGGQDPIIRNRNNNICIYPSVSAPTTGTHQVSNPSVNDPSVSAPSTWTQQVSNPSVKDPSVSALTTWTHQVSNPSVKEAGPQSLLSEVATGFLIWAVTVTALIIFYGLRKLVKFWINRCCPALNISDIHLLSPSSYTTSADTDTPQQPRQQAPIPQLGQQATAPQPGQQASAPQPGQQTPAPQPGQQAPIQQLGQQATAPQPGQQAPAPQPEQQAPVPQQGQQTPASQLGQQVLDPQPGQQAHYSPPTTRSKSAKKKLMFESQL